MTTIDEMPPSGPASALPAGFRRLVASTLSSGAPAGPSLRATRGTNTPNLGLIQPDLLDAALISELNYNFGRLDDAILSSTAATLTGFTLVEPILIRPAVDDLSLMQHTHQSALGGGGLDGAAVTTGTIGDGPLLRQTGASAATLNVAPPLNLDGAAGTPRGVVVRTGTPQAGYAPRWFVGADGAPENPGQSDGSDFTIGQANDGGVYAPVPALRLRRLDGEAYFGGGVRVTPHPSDGVALYDTDGHLWKSDGPGGNLLLSTPPDTAVGFAVAGDPIGVWAQEDGLYINDAIARLRFATRVGPKVVLYGDDLTHTHYGLGVEAGTLALTVSQAVDGVAVGYRTSPAGAWTETSRINANGTVKGQALAPSVWLPGICWEPGSSPPTQRLETDGDARRWLWRYSSGGNNYMHCPVPIPPKYNGGPVRFTLYWRSVGGGGGFTWRVGASIRSSGSAAPGNGMLADANGVSSTGANTTTITQWTWAGGNYQSQEFILYLQRLDSNGQAADVEGLYVEFGV